MSRKTSQVAVERLEDMAAAGEEILDCYRVLKKTSANIVGQVLANQGKFYEWNHYPSGDVYDRETHAQYYYHSHRPEAGEHGHFHTFMRSPGMPAGIEPTSYDGDWERPMGKDALAHLIAIAMDKKGFPIGLFSTNRWVTGETWYSADDTIAMLDSFLIDHTWPCWATNKWVSAMIRLFYPEICELIRERDEAVAGHQAAHPDEDVYEDRSLDITSKRKISVDKQIARVTRELKKARAA